MGKTKTKGLAEKVRNKKKPTTGKVNPFEVKFNRQKHNVLGRKVTKDNKGKPGVSRSKAIKKRKETLLVEYKNRGKVNKFVDRRFGENDPEMSVEDKMLQRFALERQKTHEKSDIFKLNEEEDLTHYGQSLSEIEKFEDPVASDSENEFDKGKIDAKMVADEHFGGFLTKKVDGKDGSIQKSWKERMEEIIAKSKKEKYERQHEREKQTQETDKLDLEFKDLQAVLSGSFVGKGATKPPRPKADDYDMMVRELQFEVKGKATDRLKTEEEIAKEDAEKLQKLESERQQRMMGISDTPQRSHVSADDLDDGFNLDKSDKKVRFEVKYKDGQLVTEVDDDDEHEEEPENREDDASDEEEDSDDDEEGDRDDGEDESEDENEAPGLEGTSDLESSDEEGNDGVTEKVENVSIDGKKGGNTGILKQKQRLAKSADISQIIENAKKELPYTFEAPETYDDFLAVMEGHTEEDQLIILERLRKCHHPSLAEGNKEKLQILYTMVLQYFCEMAVQKTPQLEFANKLVKHLYAMTQQNPGACGKTVQETVISQQHMFNDFVERRNGKGIFPTLDTLMLLKLVSVLFPTSDFKHPVVTPAMLFLSQIITQCSLTTNRDVASGLFTCTLFLEYVSFSKRFVPEVINFLMGIIFLAIEKKSNTFEDVVHPFKPVGKSIDLLRLENASLNVPIENLKLSELFSITGRKHLDSDTFKVQSVAHALSMLTGFAKLYASLPSAHEIFAPVKTICQKLPIEKYPSEVKELQDEFLEQCDILESKRKCRKHMIMPKNKPQPIQMFEPKVEESFDGKKKRGGTRDFNEKQRDLHKYKKELKGARKEIIKDMKFVHDQKLKEQVERDSERKRKVKEIYGQLATQEGDYKAMKRNKDKM